jgi:hypothetical protein
MEKTNMYSEWERSKTETFWREIAPCDHVVQFYENDNVFIDALAGYVGGGINAGDCCIVIATKNHLEALEHRLRMYGVYVHTLIDDNRYIPLNAEETLAKFMVNGWPDEELFMKTVSELITKAKSSQRNVRAFGEMVALLWEKGYTSATVHLEHLWNKFCANEALTLFCAYPQKSFTENDISVNHICCAHSKMIDGAENQLTEVLYRNIYQPDAIAQIA